MKTKEQRAEQIKEVIELLKGEDPRSKPTYISIDDENGSFVNYSGKRHNVQLSFDEAVSLHNKYPGVLTIQWCNENSIPVLKNVKTISFRHD
jgi:hypothetical protein